MSCFGLQQKIAAYEAESSVAVAVAGDSAFAAAFVAGVAAEMWEHLQS